MNDIKIEYIMSRVEEAQKILRDLCAEHPDCFEHVLLCSVVKDDENMILEDFKMIEPNNLEIYEEILYKRLKYYDELERFSPFINQGAFFVRCNLDEYKFDDFKPNATNWVRKDSSYKVVEVVRSTYQKRLFFKIENIDYGITIVPPYRNGLFDSKRFDVALDYYSKNN